MHVYIYAHIFMYIHTFLFIYLDIYIYTYIRAYVCIYIYIYYTYITWAAFDISKSHRRNSYSGSMPFLPLSA